MPTASGRSLDMVDTPAEQIDFRDLAWSLSRLPRCNANTPGKNIVSIAQHQVWGCDTLYRETGDRLTAAAFLLHDGHEFAIGDMTTPTLDAVTVYSRRLFCLAPDVVVRDSFHALKANFDRAIYAAAGLPWPLDAARAEAVRSMDLRVLRAERDWLYAVPPRLWAPEVEFAIPADHFGGFFNWAWPQAKALTVFCERLQAFCPALADFTWRGPL